jgi:hypothetical protein
LLWNGAANTAVDLNPTALLGTGGTSSAQGTGGTQQVGYAQSSLTLGFDHAILWTGTANSAVDLHSAGLTSVRWGQIRSSRALATNGVLQTGYGVFGTSAVVALLWNGSANSVLDLGDLLPDGFNTSYATGIDAQGNVFGTARDAIGTYHAIEWVAAPEPTALAPILIAGYSLLRRTRRRFASDQG